MANSSAAKKRTELTVLPMTVWPSGLRRWLQAPVRKGVGSNPTAASENSGSRLSECPPATLVLALAVVFAPATTHCERQMYAHLATGKLWGIKEEHQLVSSCPGHDMRNVGLQMERHHCLSFVCVPSCGSCVVRSLQHVGGWRRAICLPTVHEVNISAFTQWQTARWQKKELSQL